MDKLPLLLSVPHAGLRVPPEVTDICILSKDDIVKDGDEHAAAIYCPLEQYVNAFVTIDIARAIVDLNRAEDDFRKDGVIKTPYLLECSGLPRVSFSRINRSLTGQVSQALSQSTQVACENRCCAWC